MRYHILRLEGPAIGPHTDIDLGGFRIKDIQAHDQHPDLSIESDCVLPQNSLPRDRYICAAAWFATNLYKGLGDIVHDTDYRGLALVFSNAMRDPIVEHLVNCNQGVPFVPDYKLARD